MSGPIGLSPGYGREFKTAQRSFPPQAEKTAERNWTLSGGDNPLNSLVIKNFYLPWLALVGLRYRSVTDIWVQAVISTSGGDNRIEPARGGLPNYH